MLAVANGQVYRQEARHGTRAMTPDDYRAVVLLHELGHLVGIFGSDIGSPLSQEYTEQVIEHCFK